MPPAKRIRTQGHFRASSSLSQPSLPVAGNTPAPAPASSVSQTSSLPLAPQRATNREPVRQLRHEDYTIGWICALDIELAAAQEMLDEEHKRLPRNASDTNSYTLGRIGEHNTVIVALGLTGTNSAASAVARMQSTFPSVQFGVLVGIGGGVPSAKADIRLGDVVVCQPSKDCGGVIQYDLGKTRPDGVERTGFLNAPPMALLNAVVSLKASHLKGRVVFLDYLANLSNQSLFARDKAGPDVLYDPVYNHEEGEENCKNCKEEHSVRRQTRGEHVMVHYGTIASGNQVMRDAKERDKVSKELGGVLCFEMEAAGVMNSFPCLPVRGICDYSDSHKNKSWQPFAAGTAAAYAKELLLLLP
ncbi:purine and uridine phosphorylase, partial [Trichodelitschia bisporula]